MPNLRSPFKLYGGRLLILLIAVSLFMITRAYAATNLQSPPTPEAPISPTTTPNETSEIEIVVPNLSISDEYCLSCHGLPGDTISLQNGDVLDLYVPAEMHEQSVHGTQGYACVQCHTTVGEYPHPSFEASDRRDATLQLNQVCNRCHSLQAEQEIDGVHAQARSAGFPQAAVCVDCHTAHEVRQLHDLKTGELLPDTRVWITERCSLCHNEIFQKYSESVHGAALKDGNPDVPTCIDCHGVHNIENPESTYFRLRSPEICAKCHTDPKIMAQYGLSTNVLDTYVSDFHGTTVAIFEKTAPDAEVNKPVCYDCHGVHDISRVDDPHSGLQMKENLLARCQVCHPDANTSFPAAWMSHYIPSPDNYSLVYYVNLFYKFFIPFTLGGMALLVVMDAGRMLLNRRGEKRRKHPAIQEEAPQEALQPMSDAVLTQNVSELLAESPAEGDEPPPTIDQTPLDHDQSIDIISAIEPVADGNSELSHPPIDPGKMNLESDTAEGEDE